MDILRFSFFKVSPKFLRWPELFFIFVFFAFKTKRGKPAFPGAAPLDSMGLTDAGRRRRSGAAHGDAERKIPASVSRESATARDGNVIVTPLFTRALRPAAATPDSLLIHHCGRHPSSFLLLTPPHNPTTPPFITHSSCTPSHRPIYRGVALLESHLLSALRESHLSLRLHLVLFNI